MTNKHKMNELETVVIKSGSEIQKISAEDFPNVIGSAIARIEELDKKYQKAEMSVGRAKKDTNLVETTANNAKQKVLSAKSKAEEVEKLKAGFIHRKATIESLQEGHVDLAKSQLDIADTVMQITNVQGNLAKAQGDTMEALKLTFDFDKEIANATKYLFLLGCSSIAASQTVCRTLEMKLRDASEEELSEYARQELENVVNNLKAQESILERQKQTEEDLDLFVSVVNENTEYIKMHDKIIKEQASQIADSIQKEADLDKRLFNSESKDIEQDKRLDASNEKDAEQDLRLAAGDEKDAEQDKRLAAGDEKDAEQDRRLATSEKTDMEHDLRLEEAEIKINAQDILINNLTKELEESNQFISELSQSIQDLHVAIGTKSSKAGLYGAYVAGIVGIIIATLSIVL